MSEFKFQLGDKLMDQVTGFKGICIAVNHWLNGCKQYCIKPKVNDKGEIVEGEWIDEQQVKLIKSKALEVVPLITGGPNKDAPKT